MRALALPRKSPRNHDARARQEKAPGLARTTPRRAPARAFLASRSAPPPGDPPAAVAEPPAETDAWWLSRSQTPTFSRRRIALSDEHARALRAKGAGGVAARIVVEFNGERFGGARVAGKDGRFELDLGDALAEEMAEVLDEDDELAIELLGGKGEAMVAIHPYVAAGR